MAREPTRDGDTWSEDEHDDWFAEESEPTGGFLVSWLEERHGAPDELTIFPADAPDEKRVVAWVSAREGSFVDLEEME